MDDNFAVRTCIASILASQGYFVQQAESAENALSLFESREFDLVITDLNMGKMNGLEFSRHIGSRCKDHCPPIILVTSDAYSMKDVAAYPIREIIHKPFRLDLFRATVDNVLALSSLPGKRTAAIP